jgi:hypothetical protein
MLRPFRMEFAGVASRRAISHVVSRFIVLMLATVVGLATLQGCGGGGGGGTTTSQAPVLTNVTVTPDSAAASLTIDINGSFTFSDPDGDLNGGSFNYTYDGVTYSFPLPAELAGVTSATIVFVLQAILNSDTGTASFPCWLVDGAGHSSNIFEVSFTQLWTRQSGTALEDIGEGIAIDSADHVLVAGTTKGDLDGETNPGGASVFVTKYAPDTSRAWTRVFGSSLDDTGRAVARDSGDNVYVVGDTLGASFGGVVANGTLNGFLTKFDGSGMRQWTRLIGTTSSERAHAVATDSANNIYVVGGTYGGLDDEVNSGNSDAFLTKFDSSGTRQWTRLLGTTGSDTAYGVAVDAAGNAYVTGGIESLEGGTANSDVFVAKYAPDGTRTWVRQFGTFCSEWANSIALGTGGSLYVVGEITQCAFPGNTSSGGYDAFVAQLDGGGDLQWVRQFGTSNHDKAKGVTTDSAGNAYVTGYLDSVSGSPTDSAEGHVIFLAKYDPAGNQAWLEQEAAGVSWWNQGRAAATASNDNIFLTGRVHGQLDGHVNVGEDDVFILKFDGGGTRR